jgi:hypothetical protein
MLEKRFIDLLEQYKEQMKNIKLTPNVIEKLKYIHSCLDHIENEIDDLQLDLSKPENKLYEQAQKDLGPIILAYLLRES